MKRQLLTACLSLPLLSAAAWAQTAAPNIIDIRPVVGDISTLVVDVIPITAITLPLHSDTIAIEGAPLAITAEPVTISAEPKAIVAEPKAIVATPKALNADTGVLNGGQATLGDNSQPIAANVTALNKAMAEIGAKETKREIRVNLSSDVLFDFDSAQIKPQAAAALSQTGVIIHQRRRGRVWIYGHTDSKGSDAYNLRLSGQRAEAVKYWFIVNGRFPNAIFATKGWGERYPASANTNAYGDDNPQGRARNRRVEIIIETVQSQ